jgi:hypothetical protein
MLTPAWRKCGKSQSGKKMKNPLNFWPGVAERDNGTFAERL